MLVQLLGSIDGGKHLQEGSELLLKGLSAEILTRPTSTSTKTLHECVARKRMTSECCSE